MVVSDGVNVAVEVFEAAAVGVDVDVCEAIGDEVIDGVSVAVSASSGAAVASIGARVLVAIGAKVSVTCGRRRLQALMNRATSSKVKPPRMRNCDSSAHISMSYATDLIIAGAQADTRQRRARPATESGQEDQGDRGEAPQRLPAR